MGLHIFLVYVIKMLRVIDTEATHYVKDMDRDLEYFLTSFLRFDIYVRDNSRFEFFQ